MRCPVWGEVRDLSQRYLSPAWAGPPLRPGHWTLSSGKTPGRPASATGLGSTWREGR